MGGLHTFMQARLSPLPSPPLLLPFLPPLFGPVSVLTPPALQWPRALLTDSGGFQMVSLLDLAKVVVQCSALGLLRGVLRLILPGFYSAFCYCSCLIVRPI